MTDDCCPVASDVLGEELRGRSSFCLGRRSRPPWWRDLRTQPFLLRILKYRTISMTLNKRNIDCPKKFTFIYCCCTYHRNGHELLYPSLILFIPTTNKPARASGATFHDFDAVFRRFQIPPVADIYIGSRISTIRIFCSVSLCSEFFHCDGTGIRSTISILQARLKDFRNTTHSTKDIAHMNRSKKVLASKMRRDSLNLAHLYHNTSALNFNSFFRFFVPLCFYLHVYNVLALSFILPLEDDPGNKGRGGFPPNICVERTKTTAISTVARRLPNCQF